MIYGKNEYIKLNRNIVTWSRYKNVNTKVVYIHCLLRANWKDGEWKGVPIKRGQFISSVSKLAEECGLTYSKTRTALDHLISDGNIETVVLDFSQEDSRKHLQGKPTIFTVVGYDEYQAVSENIETNSQNFSENIERRFATIEEIKKDKEVKNIRNNNNPPISPFGDGEDEKPKKNTDSLPPKEAQEKIHESIDNSELSTPAKEKLKEFVEYKRSEIKKPYKSPKRFQSTDLKQTIKTEKEYGADATISCIDDCMGHGYQGLFFNNAGKYSKQGGEKKGFNATEFLRRYEE